MIDPATLEDDLLDPTLARIVQSVETHDPGHWVNQTAAYAGDIQERSLARLVERGILRREDDRFMRRVPRAALPDHRQQDRPGSEVSDHGGPDSAMRFRMRAISSSSPMPMLAVYSAAFFLDRSLRAPPNASLRSARWT